MKWMQRVTVLAMIAVLLVVAGCSSSDKPAKDAVVDSLKKMSEMNAYAFTGTIGINDVSIPTSESDKFGFATFFTSMLKGAKISFDGQYDRDAKRTDMTMKVEYKSDGSSTTLEVPVIMTDEKMFVKIPNVPFFPLPESITSKFIEIDMKQLMEEQGAGTAATALDSDKMIKLSSDLLLAVIEPFESKDYFSEPKAADVEGLPQDVEYDDLIQFQLTSETFPAAVEVIANKVAPAILDLLSSDEEYMNLLNLKKEDLDKAKQELTDNSAQAIEEIKKAVKVNNFKLTTGVKDGYMTFQGVNADVVVTDENNAETKLNLSAQSQYSDINKKQTFKQEIPTDTTKLEDLAKSLGVDLTQPVLQ
ncbi:hypothetical protein DFQ01_12156 [Paenibacillus cellulosilyticus]|uniref:Lipoprotein n=1 Tax=Paenibacillus cellulosilyticus TaxID=375489 RepID=A0A2V2YXS0_9BACL|nr:hypothetical protein [Paenibacillus cellulosilyticus]PWV97413.1 hypothetical protein DFQ01_12156 [Paenibacillus cellulosilyticus]QKS48546.1 hypothetical protein HUB94_30395 [Paenibacillus cellulosilyticus]